MENSEPSTNSKMALMDHFVELRKRLIYISLAVVLTTLAAFLFASSLFEILNRPLVKNFVGQSIIGTSPAEAFMIKLKVSVFFGIILALPWIFYQAWLFVAPGLHDNERKLAIPFVASATALFLTGISFGYFLVMPLAFLSLIHI